jgi:hypothetical protein
MRVLLFARAFGWRFRPGLVALSSARRYSITDITDITDALGDFVGDEPSKSRIVDTAACDGAFLDKLRDDPHVGEMA